MAAPDFSIKTVNTNILNLLTDAGIDGLHVDDIVKLLGYSAQRDLAPRLRDLRGRGEIKEKQGRWSLVVKKKKTCSEDLPNISLPGNEKFTSYKNSLQEYCQKKGSSVPHYSAKREKDGFVGTVSFSDTQLRSKHVCGTSKEADTRAAFEALQQLGYLKVEGKFEQSTNVLKRKSCENDLVAPTVIAAKQTKLESKECDTFKSKLNVYAQKNKIPQPKYDTIAVADGFFSTVYVDNRPYKGLACCPKRKEAEQSAAQAALNVLVGTQQSDEGMELGEAEVTEVICEPRQASHPGEFKNQLQEFCVKMGKGMPTYETQSNTSDGTFQSTVTVQGIQYTGPFANRKKNAEGKAAEEALKALKSKT